MPYRRPLRRRSARTQSATELRPGKRRRKKFGVALLVTGLALLIFIACAASYLKELSTEIAVADARDVITMDVNTAIADIMREGDYGGDYFVTFEKNDAGEVAAISCNMARINALSAEILDRVIGAANGYTTTVKIPAGNLTGFSLLMGRGPKITVEIITLTSSRVEFHNSIVTAGINQTKHQINLEVMVDIDIVVPWGSETTQVATEVLIADTIIVGQVPQTYLSMDGSHNEG